MFHRKKVKGAGEKSGLASSKDTLVSLASKAKRRGRRQLSLLGVKNWYANRVGFRDK